MNNAQAMNRLRKAVHSVDVPPELESLIRNKIRASASELPISQNRLKQAVDSVDVPPFLEARIRNSLRSAPRRHWLPRLATVGAAAAVVVGVMIAYQLGHLRLTVSSQESYIASVSSQIATLMRVGLGDHIHCSIFRKYPKQAPTTEEFVSKLGPNYAPLIAIVRDQIPQNYEMRLAHQCRYHGRQFIHLSLMDGSSLVSLVITRKNPGESFRTEDMLPALVQSGIPMYQSDVQRFQMTAYETRDYLVYFISDLPKQQNTDLMLAMAPKVTAVLKKLEL